MSISEMKSYTYLKNCISLVCGIIVLFFCTTSCTNTPSKYAQITGTFRGETEGKEIHLCKVEHGSTTSIATTLASINGDFAFTYSVDDPGIYVVNVVWESTQQIVRKDHDLKRFYLENGTDLNIELNEGSYKLLNSNNSKNDLLSEWNIIADTVFTYSHGFRYNTLNYTDFFPLLPDFMEKAEAFKSKISSGDKNFDELVKLMVETDMKSAALSLLYTPRSEQPKKEDYPDFYDELLENGAPKSERLLELANGYRFLRFYSLNKVLNSTIDLKSPEARLDAELGSMQNDLLKGYFSLESAKRFTTYDKKYLAFKKKISAYMTTEYLQSKLAGFEMSIRKFAEGERAFDFSGEDANGKTHNLSDYKGNLVYVDVWATWCGPCRAQIPALKRLEKKYHGRPITFLSISLDKEKDRQKWVDFVKNKDLKGVQLIADKAFDSTVAKVYGIKGIPRFMLFDKEGNIVTIDAPRPSEERTEGLINKYL